MRSVTRERTAYDQIVHINNYSLGTRTISIRHYFHRSLQGDEFQIIMFMQNVANHCSAGTALSSMEIRPNDEKLMTMIKLT